MLRRQDFVNNKLDFSNKKLEIWDMLCVKNYDINAYNGSEFLGFWDQSGSWENKYKW